MGAVSPGQAAYEKWCERINPKGGKLFKPLPIQPWDKLKPATKSTWEAVAQAAIEHNRRRGR